MSIERVLAVASQKQADLVGIYYRLTPGTGERLLADVAEAADELRGAAMRFAFAGTPPAAVRAAELGFLTATLSSTSRALLPQGRTCLRNSTASA